MIKFGAILILVMATLMFAESARIKSSFENGDFSGWNTQGEGWSVYGKAASDGTKTAMCTIEKGAAPEMKACAMEIAKADPGWVVSAKLDIAGRIKSNSSKVNLAIMCIDEAGTTLREERKQITAPTTDFQTVVLPELLIPSGTKETYFMIVVEVTQESSAKEWWRFDNVVLEVK